MSDTSVRLAGIEKRFDDVVAVHPLDLEVAAGELTVLVGPSGCGKTTVLRVIAGLEPPTAGGVYIGGRPVNDVEPADRDIAMVFQNYALYPHMSVRQNLGFGLAMRRVPEPERSKRVLRAADVLGLTALLDRRPAQLSGGQRQRVALGRALVREPAVFLFDEPLSNLDARLRVEMRAEIADLHRRLGTTTIYVTHDQVEAMTLGQRIAVLDRGVLQQYAPPLDVYDSPANLFTARFIGSPEMNTVAGTAQVVGGRTSFRVGSLVLRFGGAAAGPAVAGIRPESLALSAPGAAGIDFHARVHRTEMLGNEQLVTLDAPDGTTWVARARATERYAPDQRVGVTLDRSRVHLFDADGTRVATGVA